MLLKGVEASDMMVRLVAAVMPAVTARIVSHANGMRLRKGHGGT